jgi:hypothetical protein
VVFVKLLYRERDLMSVILQQVGLTNFVVFVELLYRVRELMSVILQLVVSSRNTVVFVELLYREEASCSDTAAGEFE